jgi:hypothetical protein
VALTADTTWRWHMELQARGIDSPHARFWRQMVRYLADVRAKDRATPPGVLGRTERTFVEPGQAVALLARVRDAEGATAAATAFVTVVPADGGPSRTVALTASPTLGEYEGSFVPSASGRYTLRFIANDAAGSALGQDELPLIVAAPAAELDRLARDDATLRLIAETTGGQYADLHALPDLLDQWVARLAAPGPAAQARVVGLYNFPLGFVLFVVVLTVEWMLRRRWQLQ